MGATCLMRRQCLYVDPLAAARLAEQKIPTASVTLKLACDVSVSDGERSDADGREASLTKEGAKIRETPKKRKES